MNRVCLWGWNKVISEMRTLLKTVLITLVFGLVAQIQSSLASPSDKAVVSDIDIRFDGKDRTQVIIYSSKNLDYSESAMFANGMRYWLDFDLLTWALPGGSDSKGVGEGRGHIQYYRYAHHKPSGSPDRAMVSRLVFVLDQPVYVDTAYSLPPDAGDKRWKVVLIFKKTDEETFKKLKPVNISENSDKVRLIIGNDPKKQPVVRVKVDDVKLGQTKPIIVIDPGHGGKDPGALNGKIAVEKDIVLKASLKLKKLLEDTKNYKVILTRSSDVYVEHEERIRIAREANADLFISIHADSAGSHTVKGASVYTLSEKGDARLESYLKDGDWNMPVEFHPGDTKAAPDSEVEDILLSLLTRETLGHSADFAKLLIPELAKAGPVLRNTHRQANYYVLLSPNVPAVLLEIGFLTNTDDVKRLTKGDGVDNSMAAVKRAIDRYFVTHKRSESDI